MLALESVQTLEQVCHPLFASVLNDSLRKRTVDSGGEWLHAKCTSFYWKKAPEKLDG